MHFESIGNFLYLWIIPGVLLLAWRGYGKRTRISRLFHFPVAWTAAYRTRFLLRIGLFVVGLFLLIFGLAGPSWRERSRVVRRSGRDVVFLIDVSRSMLAEDLAPNRLERAKIAVIDALEAVDGDRVALVAFAGNSVIKCPLTWDYGFFRSAVASLSVESVSRGGSLLGDAVRKVMSEVFDDREGAWRDIVILSDGGDSESLPVRAAEAAGSAGVRLLVIGLGDESAGARIPLDTEEGRREFLTYEGQEVWSQLDAESLRAMALATPQGRYLNAGTGNFDLGEIYSAFIRSAGSRMQDEDIVTEYENMYQVFLLAALLFLSLSVFLPRSREES